MMAYTLKLGLEVNLVMEMFNAYLFHLLTIHLRHKCYSTHNDRPQFVNTCK